jgi:hypothetical protein
MALPMKRSLVSLLTVGLLACASATATCACSFFAPPASKVRAGELFEAAHPTYDPYFRDVHALQMEIASWEEQKRSARRPLVDVLKLDPDAADVTVVQATHERMLGVSREAGNVRLDVSEGQARVVVQNAAKLDESARATFQAIETCVRNEIDRAKGLRDVPAKADALLKQGRALEPHVRDDLSRRGGRAPKQVLEELQASYDVLSEISKSSRLAVREADDFVADLRRAVGSDMAESAARPSASSKASAARATKPARTGEEIPRRPETPRPKPVEVDAPKPKPVETKPEEPKKPAAKDEFNP